MKRDDADEPEHELERQPAAKMKRDALMSNAQSRDVTSESNGGIANDALMRIMLLVGLPKGQD